MFETTSQIIIIITYHYLFSYSHYPMISHDSLVQ